MASLDYEFRVDGHFPEQGRETFCDMRVDDVPNGAVLRGGVIDDAHLHGILDQLHAWGLTVVSARPVEVTARRGGGGQDEGG